VRKIAYPAPRNPSLHYNYGILLLDAGSPDAKPHLEFACRARIATACQLLKPF
jgi:hypothetical protein